MTDSVGGRRSEKSQVYPPWLVRAVLQALQEYIRERRDLASFKVGPSLHERMIGPQSDEVADEL